MCGGTLEINENQSTAVCEYCGTKQTLPRLDDDRRANLYDRANHFRRNNEFDKAMGIYEQILNEDNTDAEAYWSLVLCRYGIEYVEDPATHKRVPTVNRAQFTSIFDDDNYKSALQYADGYQKSIYEEEAAAINEIQKGILAISQKEEPFDVFICYKETDANGRRTQDSVLANDLYHQLTQEGFKVFFSRITLEDKLGVAYEPYIFAALNSAKVMVVIGTKPEHFNAVWVKNEWSRYLALIKNGAKKVLIPAYRDMDPYDLPEEFSHLQAQDMSKLGFMQDLIRGIKKLAADEPKTVVKETVVASAAGEVGPLLRRAFMFLEDGDWKSADEYCERVLDIDPENAQAYLGKLMAELRCGKRENLKEQAKPFDNKNNYQKALRFADETLKAELQGDIEHINARNEHDRQQGIYDDAIDDMGAAHTEEDYLAAAEEFKSIPGFLDADAKVKECEEKAEVARKDYILNDGIRYQKGDTIEQLEMAISAFRTVPGWKDADRHLADCRARIEEIKARNERQRIEAERKAEEARLAAAQAAKKRKKIIAITTPIVCACIAFLIVLTTVIIPSYKKTVYIEKYGQEAYEKFFHSNVGDCITFGSYEQDNDTSNGKEEIEWIVLDKSHGKTLLISKYALDCQKYYNSYTSVTWEQCSLRTWLNGTFLNKAFSETEQNQIATINVLADKNPEYSTNPGNATEDKIFLLSITEAEKYFSSDKARRCSATAYAKAQGAYTNTSNGNCWWWLRSPGYVQDSAAAVSTVGSVDYYGGSVSNDFYAIRPALWVSFE